MHKEYNKKNSLFFNKVSPKDQALCMWYREQNKFKMQPEDHDLISVVDSLNRDGDN